MAKTRLALFGTLHVFRLEPSIALGPSSVSLLLGYLALYGSGGRAVPRSILAGKLWPGLSGDHARQKLNQTLYRLRQTSGPDALWLQTDGATIRLTEVDIDVHAFKRLAGSTQLVDWQAAIELYSGDLLEDLDADWLLIPRITLREQFLNTLARLCTTMVASGQFADALSYARRWALADSFNEDAHRLVMQLYARLGRHMAALQHYDELVKLLDDEFQSAPLAETRALANALRAEYDPDPHLLWRPGLVGRRAERARLLRCVEEVHQGHGHLLLIEGEAGIGKTRLLEALAESASWRGLRVVWGSASREESGPFAPLDIAIRAAISGPRVERIATALTPAAAELVHTLRAHIDPPVEVSVNGASSRPFRPGLEQHATATIAAAYADILRALAATQPHLVILDNMHWADVRCWSALRACLVDLHAQPLLVVLSYRIDELRSDRVAWNALREFDSDIAQRMVLDGLSPDDCREMARLYGHALDRESGLQLWERTAGNPLFIEQLLAASGAETFPQTLGGLLDKRLVSLPAAARTALDVAATLGAEWPHDIWQEIVGPEAIQTLPLLLERQFVVEYDRGYRFRHELLREHMEVLFTSEQRRDLHRRVAAVLKRREVEPLALAWHYAQAEMWSEAGRAYREAGDRAMAAQQFEAARDAYESALTMMARGLAAVDQQQALRERLAAIAQTEARWRALEPPSKIGHVQLARVSVPLGRALEDDERVIVRWTVDAGVSDALLQHDAGKVFLRHHRILRLLNEARAQGGAPTDADLARALGVSERTIVADIAALRRAGHEITTRRRK